MNIKKRTCGTCSSFNPAPTGEEPTCWNLVSFTELANTPQAVTRQPLATDTGCPSHLTPKENEEDIEFVERQRVNGGFEEMFRACNATQETRDLMRRVAGDGKAK